MKNWQFVSYKAKALIQRIPPQIVENVRPYIELFYNKKIPIILSLKHLSFRINMKYVKLHTLITHRGKNYKYFRIHKHNGGYRLISVPSPELLIVQKWINTNILSQAEDNPYSYAFTKGKSIKDCANEHKGCKWLIKIDIRNFFDSISEIKVYKYFASLGYSKLVSLELARLCTVTAPDDQQIYLPNRKPTFITYIKNHQSKWLVWRKGKYKFYVEEKVGFLPQGAPTSPMLANLIVRPMDYEIAEYTKSEDLIYTRYADDLFISSSSRDFCDYKARQVIRHIYKILYKYGFDYNYQKTKIFRPGSRKIILGLLVSNNKIGIQKKQKAFMECQLYYLIKDPIKHCHCCNIENLFSYCNYLKGLLSYIHDVDYSFYHYLEKRQLIPNWDTFLSI